MPDPILSPNTPQSDSPALPGKGRRIAWFIHGAELYGAQRAIISLTSAITQLGWQPHIVALDQGPALEACQKMGLPTQILLSKHNPRLSESRSVFGRLQTLLEITRFQKYIAAPLRAALENIQPAALHILPVNVLAAGGRVARQLNIPAFWEMTNCISSHYPMQLNRRAYTWTCRKNHVIPIANSHYTASTLGTSKLQTQVIHLGADPQIFNPNRVTPITRAEANIPPNATLFGMIARLDPLKGQERFLEALIKQSQNDPSIHLLIVGGPKGDPLADEVDRNIRQIARAHNWTDRLHIMGDTTEPQRWYPLADVVVNAYLGEEAFGLSIIEAMMMRRPVLAHVLGGPAETVVNNSTGWHVPTPSLDDFVTGITRALADRPRWTAMGNAGHDRALQLFTQVQAQNYIHFVEQSIAEVTRR